MTTPGAPGRLASAEVFVDRLLHDLKQPLNLIRVLAQDVRIDVAKNRLDPATLPATMKGIEQSADELAMQLDRVRTFLRSTGHDEPEESTDVNEACRVIMARLRTEQPNLQLTEALAPGLLPAAIALPALLQVLWEVLGNAAHAATEGQTQSPRIHLATSAGHDEIEVLVQDNGPGIPAADRDKIFEPFFTTRPDAAGLGLALATALIADARGRLTLLDPDGSGARLRIALPAADRPPAAGQ